MSSEDLGMLFIPELGLLVKIQEDAKGEYVVLPGSKKKHYLKEV